MKQKTFTSVRAEEHVISEANGRISREQIVLNAPADDVLAGTVLGRINLGAAVVAHAANAGNTGNGVFAAEATADAGAPGGRYTVTFTAAAANGGTYRVEKPDGTQDGIGHVGVAYDGSINMTINDGAADFVVGDGFTVTVTYAEGSGKYEPLTLAAVNGREIAAAILAPTEIATEDADDIRTSAHVRDCEVNGWKLQWPDAITDDEKATAEAQLAEQGIIVRY